MDHTSYFLSFKLSFTLTDLFLNQEKHEIDMPKGAWMLDNGPMHSPLPIQRVQSTSSILPLFRPYLFYNTFNKNISRARDLIYSLPSILFI